jgi:ABC-type oligopeptide transport system substrate-binding subunit
LDPASWNSFVLSNHKHDQIAMRNQGNLGLTFDPFRQIARFTSGYSTNYIMVADPVYDAFYAKSQAATSVDGVKQVLRDANEYIARQHWSISLLEPNVFSLCQPWIKGYTGQNNGFSNGASGASVLLFQYPARFWIDQNMKKSLGH